ncbi:hypothetical protein PINS_up012930 [Pythium insidiosum]|nr:hypothetical protein PINS_up012930 [Pythium insidiosum]
MGDLCARSFARASALFVFNGVDIICGTALQVYALYLGLNHFATGMALRAHSGSWAGVMILMAAMSCFVLASSSFTQGPAINRFLREHQADLKLTDDELRRFEESNSEYNRARDRRKYEYRSLGALKDLDDNLLNVRKEHEVSSKYAALRDKYKNKYGKGDGNEPEREVDALRVTTRNTWHSHSAVFVVLQLDVERRRENPHRAPQLLVAAASTPRIVAAVRLQ